MKRNQKGFGAVEVLLLLILLSIVGFTGYYVYHTKNNTDSTLNSAAATGATQPASSALTLQDAVTHTKVVYSSWENGTTKGTKLSDDSAWAQNPDNTISALDLQLINANKSWFTPAFVTQANNYQTSNTTPPGFGLLACQGGIAYFHNGSVKVTGDKLENKVAFVNVSYDQGMTGVTTIHVPVTLKDVSGKWAIDSIDLSDCS